MERVTCSGTYGKNSSKLESLSAMFSMGLKWPASMSTTWLPPFFAA